MIVIVNEDLITTLLLRPAVEEFRKSALVKLPATQQYSGTFSTQWPKTGVFCFTL